jgi:hypothetical protein
MALTHSLVPNLASGKEPSSSSGELWIEGLRRFIASGYTYQNLFRKRCRRNQKAYAITIVIDSVRRLFTLFNAYHAMTTIGTILASLHLVPDSDGVVADVIVSSSCKVFLLMSNIPVSQFSDNGMISDILRAIEHVSGKLGSGCQAALQLAARIQKGGSVKYLS